MSISVDEEGFKAVPRNDCPRCERPNNLFDRKCVNCGARLDTPAARAYNEKLWRASLPESEQQGSAPELPVPGRRSRRNKRPPDGPLWKNWRRARWAAARAGRASRFLCGVP